MLSTEKGPPLPEDDFRLLRELISNYCGIYFADDSRYLLERRLGHRLKAHGLETFRDYYRFLLYNRGRSQELSEIIDILTVNETYFFREQKVFDALVEEILPEMRRMRPDVRRFRIWSAGCASGEEPYTIAIMVLEKALKFSGLEVEIIGSDINQRVLQKARKGVYTSNSFRGVDDYFMKKYFVEEDGSWRIKDAVRKLVSFTHVNLLDQEKVRFAGTMDVVFCRNVLIYFNQESKRRVVDGFHQIMNDGGYLLLGHAESLMNVSTAFTLKHLKSDMVYQKPRKSSAQMSDDSLFRMVWGQ